MSRITPYEFLNQIAFKHAGLTAMGSDASFRRYWRVTGADKPCLVMDAPPEKEGMLPFVTIARHLNTLGLRAPIVYAIDIENGYALIEDFGDDTFTRLLNGGGDAMPLYLAAADVLRTLHAHSDSTRIKVPSYDMKELLREASLFPDWYLGWEEESDERAHFLAAFDDVLAEVATNRSALVLKDFHVDNLMRIGPDPISLKTLGLLDFQDGLLGSPAYDIVSLLEDARRDVSDEIRSAFLDSYFQSTGDEGRASFMKEFHLLGAQRHAKVLGIFRRLQKRDHKPVYVQHLPRVARLFAAKLSLPELAPVKAVLDRYAPHWQTLTD